MKMKLIAVAAASLALSACEPAAQTTPGYTSTEGYNASVQAETPVGPAVTYVTTVNTAKIYTLCSGSDRLYIVADSWGNAIDTVPNGCALNSVQ